MRIALFIACFNDVLHPSTGKAIVRLLRRLGHEVVFPDQQTCCGQMHFNSGYQDEVVPLAQRYTEVFDKYDVTLAASGSCAAMVKNHFPVVADRVGSKQLRARVESTSGRLFELSELLIDVLGVTDTGSYFPHTVTFHPTCHTTRMLGIGDKPQRLLRNVEGMTMVDLPEAAECCGFGGTFSIHNPDVSTAMGTDKMANVISTGAEILTAADNSCLMHLGGLASRGRTRVKPLHYAEILASTHEEPLDTGTPVAEVHRPVEEYARTAAAPAKGKLAEGRTR
jgi:L-lactate dehydrogenase complex protein LldE